MRAEIINPNRADVLMEQVAKQILERIGVSWTSGVGNVVREVIRENAPRTDLDAVSVARELGILRKKARVGRSHGI
jgi:hypothetical protein